MGGGGGSEPRTGNIYRDSPGIVPKAMMRHDKKIEVSTGIISYPNL